MSSVETSADGPRARPPDGARSPAGRARFDGCIVVTHARRADVATLLPGDVRLAPPGPLGDLHPVVFVFGDVSDTCIFVGGLRVPVGRPFRDFGIYVPRVRPAGDAADHLYLTRVWSSYRLSWWSGNFHYGLPKHLARMWWYGGLFIVEDTAGSLVARAEFAAAGAWRPAGDGALERFADVRSMFALPLLGRRADGRAVRSAFAWGIEKATVRVGTGMVTLPRAPEARPFLAVPDGAFEVRGLVWDAGWPA
jgi:hypothetical protein